MTAGRKKTLRHGIPWILAILLSAAWHGFWLPRQGLRKPRVPAAPSLHLASLVFCGGSIIREPLLFTLRPAGAPHDVSNGMSRPPLSSPPPPARIVRLQVQRDPPAAPLPMSSPWNAQDPAPDYAALSEGPSFPTRPTATAPKIDLLAPWTSDSLSQTPLPETILTRQPWTAVAWFRFDDTGLPLGILIESETLPPEDLWALRTALQGWRLPRGIPDRSGAVRIRAPGGGSAAEPLRP